MDVFAFENIEKYLETTKSTLLQYHKELVNYKDIVYITNVYYNKYNHINNCHKIKL